MKNERILNDFLSGKYTGKENAIMNNVEESYVSKVLTTYFGTKKKSLKRVPMDQRVIRSYNMTEDEMLSLRTPNAEQDIIRRFNKTTYKKDDFKTLLNKAIC